MRARERAYAMPQQSNGEWSQATPEDLDDLVQLAHASEQAAHWDESAFRSYLAAPDENAPLKKIILVARGGAVLLGFVAGSWLEGEEAAELENLAIREEFRRKGLGRFLCEDFARWAAEHGAKAVSLEVRVSNVGASALYERLGFEILGRRERYYRDPIEDALLMRWEFANAIPAFIA